MQYFFEFILNVMCVNPPSNNQLMIIKVISMPYIIIYLTIEKAKVLFKINLYFRANIYRISHKFLHVSVFININ